MSRCERAALRLAACTLRLAACGAALALAACSSASMMTTGPEDASKAMGPCASSDYVDRTSPSADRTVGFGGSHGSGPFSYSPQCMTIASGQKVTFDGDFSVHPLESGGAPESGFDGTPGNPIPATTSGLNPTTVTFPSAGTFPYFCRHHYAAGMVGEVQVME